MLAEVENEFVSKLNDMSNDILTKQTTIARAMDSETTHRVLNAEMKKKVCTTGVQSEQAVSELKS